MNNNLTSELVTNSDKLSKESIEHLLNRTLSDESYVHLVTEVLLSLLETNENGNFDE